MDRRAPNRTVDRPRLTPDGAVARVTRAAVPGDEPGTAMSADRATLRRTSVTRRPISEPVDRAFI